MCGDTAAGFTIFWADDGFDTGPILLQRKTYVDPNETVDSLYNRFLFPEGVKAMVCDFYFGYSVRSWNMFYSRNTLSLHEFSIFKTFHNRIKLYNNNTFHSRNKSHCRMTFHSRNTFQFRYKFCSWQAFYCRITLYNMDTLEGRNESHCVNAFLFRFFQRSFQLKLAFTPHC